MTFFGKLRPQFCLRGAPAPAMHLRVSFTAPIHLQKTIPVHSAHPCTDCRRPHAVEARLVRLPPPLMLNRGMMGLLGPARHTIGAAAASCPLPPPAAALVAGRAPRRLALRRWRRRPTPHTMSMRPLMPPWQRTPGTLETSAPSPREAAPPEGWCWRLHRNHLPPLACCR